MPPGTITIAGKAMNKNVVYFGGAAALGIVGYAWYRNSQEGPQILTADPNLAPVDEPTDNTGFSVYGPDNARIPQTNAEWYDLVISKAQSIGVDAAAMATAIGKYLGRQPLTKAEIELVRMAIASSGTPPEGGPYNIIEVVIGGVTPPPPVLPPPPVGEIVQPPPGPPSVSVPSTRGPAGLLPLGNNNYAVAFPDTPGATQYRIRWEAPGSMHGDSSAWVPANPGVGANHFVWHFGPPQHHFTVRVQAGNSAGWDPSGILTNDAWSVP